MWLSESAKKKKIGVFFDKVMVFLVEPVKMEDMCINKIYAS
jgi:hypothetical protein